jgi:hypothetical protein
MPPAFFCDPSVQRLCHNCNPRGKAVEFQSFRMRVFYVMGNRRLCEIKGLHMLGTSESERLRVAALNLFHPTASPLSKEVVFSCCDIASQSGGSEDILNVPEIDQAGMLPTLSKEAIMLSFMGKARFFPLPFSHRFLFLGFSFRGPEWRGPGS